MSDTPATPTSIDEIAAAAVDQGPSPVPPVLKAPVKKPVVKKPVRVAVAAAIEPQPPVSDEPAAPAARSMKEFPMAETIEMMTDKSKTMFAEANERAKSTLEKGAKAFEDMNAFNKGNIEAIVESSKIAASGMQKMGQDAAVYAKASYENATTAFKSMTTVKSPTELFKLQGDFARTAFDAWMAEASRSTEAALKLAGEIAQPISNRVALAAEKIKVAA